jgi:acetyl esterase/lipase
MSQRFCSICVFATIAASAGAAVAARSEEPEQKVTRIRDVIYHRKHGVVLTMDVFRPKKQNGAAVVHVISGGWFSAHRAINPAYAKVFNDRGYTVFSVVHGSQPKYNIQEIVADMHRSIRFIRHNAKRFGIDPRRIGITGGSAGGHLSLMIGTTGNAGNPKAADPVERTSSRVQAVACFFPPTDFLNYGKPGENALGRGVLQGFRAPFDFKRFDAKTRSLVTITDEEERKKIGIAISPAYHVTRDDPPTLIIHGDADKLVPIQQAELVIDRLKKLEVPAKLVVRKGEKHGWAKIAADVPLFADWFDSHLKTSVPSKERSAKAAGSR